MTMKFTLSALLVVLLAACGGEASMQFQTTDTTTGGHGDLTVGANFTYSDAAEDVRRVVVDTPAGGADDTPATRPRWGVPGPAAHEGRDQLTPSA